MYWCIVHTLFSSILHSIQKAMVKFLGVFFNMSSCPTCIFALTLAYHIWRMGLSPWHHTCSQCRPLTSRSMTWLLCSGHRFFVIPYWHMKVSPWNNESHTFMTSVWPLPLVSISKLYFHHEFVWTRSSWLYDVGIPNLAHVYHEACYVHSWPLYDLWPQG